MNLFLAWWGRWWSPKVSSFHRHQCPETGWALIARCQHFLLSRSATFEHQLNVKLIGSLTSAEVQFHQAHGHKYMYRTSRQLVPLPFGVTPRVCWRSQSPQQPLWKTWLFPWPWQRRSYQACWALPLCRFQQLFRCIFTWKIWCLDVYLELSSVEPRVWGFWVSYDANIR